MLSFYFFNDTATTEIYTHRHTLSHPRALPICADLAAVGRIGHVVGAAAIGADPLAFDIALLPDQLAVLELARHVHVWSPSVVFQLGRHLGRRPFIPPDPPRLPRGDRQGGQAIGARAASHPPLGRAFGRPVRTGCAH